jgi:isopropylmalate/homocitrate/citramalate synthase
MEKPSCSPYNPRFVGQVPELVLAKRSDIKAIQEKLSKMNVTATEDQMKSMLKRVREHVSKYKRALTDEEFDLIVRFCT